METRHSNKGAVVGGMLLIGLGFLLLVLQNFQFTFANPFSNWYIPYTSYVIGLGLLFIVIGLSAKDSLSGLTIAGSIVLVSGLLLAFQDATRGYQTWAYVWALVFPGSIGLGLTLQSLTTQDSEQRTTGIRMMLIALIMTLVGWSFFEGIVNLSGYGLHQLTNFVGPVLLMTIGGWLLLRNRNSEVS
jgi:hypothetical protein